MRKSGFIAAFCVILVVGSGFGAEKLSDFKVKALDVIERTRPAVESGAFKELQEALSKRRIGVRFLEEGAYTSKIVNPKDKKECFLTAIPMVSHFRTGGAPPLAAVVISDGKEFRAGRFKVSFDRERNIVCELVTGEEKVVARATTLELLKEPPLALPKGEAAIAIADEGKKGERVLILCRSPYPATDEGDRECAGVIFRTGDLAWEKFAPGEEQGELARISLAKTQRREGLVIVLKGAEGEGRPRLKSLKNWAE